jgi:hypothetical protein
MNIYTYVYTHTHTHTHMCNMPSRLRTMCMTNTIGIMRRERLQNIPKFCNQKIIQNHRKYEKHIQQKYLDVLCKKTETSNSDTGTTKPNLRRIHTHRKRSNFATHYLTRLENSCKKQASSFWNILSR